MQGRKKEIRGHKRERGRRGRKRKEKEERERRSPPPPRGERRKRGEISYASPLCAHVGAQRRARRKAEKKEE